MEGRSAAFYSAALIVFLVVLGVGVFYVVQAFGVVPISYALVFRVVLTVGLGYLAIVLVGRILASLLKRVPNVRHGALLLNGYRIVAFVLLAFVVLSVAGVNGYALLAGGTFAGLVIGLAAQTVLGNVLAGFVLLVTRPFEPGDRVTVVSAQWSFLLPSYPPKFFSQDLLLPGFTGRIEELGIVFTHLGIDDGTTVRLPNSIVLQSAVLSHAVSQRWVRLKYDLPPNVDLPPVIEAVGEAIRHNEWVVEPERAQVLVNQATASSVLLSIDAICRGNNEEPPRSSLYLTVLSAVQPFLQAAREASAPATAAPPEPEPRKGRRGAAGAGPEPEGPTGGAPPPPRPGPA